MSKLRKVNFSKVESAFDRALQKLVIDHLSELAAIANVIQDSQSTLSSKTIEEIITRFQKELKRLKKGDPKLYHKLHISKEEEERIALPAAEFLKEDWERLKKLKLKIDELKRELYGQESLDAEFDKQVSHERRKHVNKRFNIRDGWLPLH